MKLTRPQMAEMKRLTLSRQPRFGAARARVQNTLVRLGLARFSHADDECVITETGLAFLRAAPSPALRPASPDAGESAAVPQPSTGGEREP